MCGSEQPLARKAYNAHDMRRVRPMLLVAALSLCANALAQNQQPRTCLAFVTTELAKGQGNFYEYFRFSGQQLKIAAGDILIYSVYLDPKDPELKGGVDIDFTDGDTPLRDLGLTDQNGIMAHGDGILTQAKGKWYTRRIPLDACAGRTTDYWDVASEGDTPGQYIQFIDDVKVQHADGSSTSIYSGGPPASPIIDNRNGYTEHPDCVPVDRAKVKDGMDLTQLDAEVIRKGESLRILDEARNDIDVVKKFLARNPDPAIELHVREAVALLDDVEKRDASPDEVEAVLHAAQHALSHTHPMMEKYTGHLVGHAHIDLQWLWEWQEGIIAAHDTFRQATKFMDEFPGFTFSQSSSCLYQTIEENYPALFKKIQEKVKAGQWEIVGGRICEGDTNMISPESHARHFLYGQRYFREKFGKTAVVGWEPDTFGHTIQMPQILKLGGCKYYYFCRGGKGKPLFWWQGLDGTRVLAFDEPANGSWYNSDLSYKQFQQMLDFEAHTGSKDMLWVYGIGNHGGGPSREYIETALGWMKDPTKPHVKFSTATEFFHQLEKYDLKKIPTVDQELNPVFDGCYTTHSEIKQLNRQSEYATMSAEAVATVASTMGFHYPGTAFRKNWEDICFNHHHDTLPGSGIHTPYERTKTVLERVLADDRDIETRALETMALRITPEKGGLSVMVFNPSGWKRSGWVNEYLVTSGVSGNDFDPTHVVAIGPDHRAYPVELLDKVSRYARFYAGDVPAFGYKVFHIVAQSLRPTGPKIVEGSDTLENNFLKVTLDRTCGVVSSIYDKISRREVCGAAGFGRLERDFEQPNGMSAWVLGQITEVQPVPASGGIPGQFIYTMPAHNHAGATTTVTQTFHLDGPKILVDVDCDWQDIGSGDAPHPLLRVAFNSNLERPIATYEVPFGALSRPSDGAESAALNWADLSTPGYGVSILNDSKSGHSADGSTLRLTLIRSSFTPDPNPNPGMHHWHYEIMPHVGDWRSAGTVKAGMELQEPLLTATVPFTAQGKAPKLFSLVDLSQSNLVATGLKRGEDAGDLILRFYESEGKQTSADVNLHLPSRKADWVNFVEDPIGPASLSGSTVHFQSHRFEIKTLRVKLAGGLNYE